MDRLKREANPPVGQLASPIPQYKKPGSTDYEAVEGQHGAPFAILKDANGNVISPATDAKLEQVKSELELVKNELQIIKANQLSGDQKVQLSGTFTSLEQTIIPRGVYNSNLSTIQLIPPQGIVPRGISLVCRVFGATGSFTQNQGIGLTIQQCGGLYPGFTVNYVETSRINSAGFVNIVWYPYTTMDGFIIPPGVAYKPVQGLFQRGSCRLVISGTFAEGEGFDCEVMALWIL